MMALLGNLVGLQQVFALRGPYLWVNPQDSPTAVIKQTTNMMIFMTIIMALFLFLVLLFFRDRKKTSEEIMAAALPEDDVSQDEIDLGSKNNNPGEKLDFKQQLNGVIRDPCFMCLMGCVFLILGSISGFIDNYVGIVSSFGFTEVSKLNSFSF